MPASLQTLGASWPEPSVEVRPALRLLRESDRRRLRCHHRRTLHDRLRLLCLLRNEAADSWRLLRHLLRNRDAHLLGLRLLHELRLRLVLRLLRLLRHHLRTLHRPLLRRDLGALLRSARLLTVRVRVSLALPLVALPLSLTLVAGYAVLRAGAP
jgi:hypothetical protein